MSVLTWEGETHPTIIMGIRDLWRSQNQIVAGIVFLSSVALPVLKVFALIYLSSRSLLRMPSSAFAVWLQKKMHALGRWSMLDIFLAAIIIGTIKLREVASVSAGPAMIYFSLIVFATMTSSELLEDLECRRSLEPR